ncbi:MAG: hypothetical protein U9N46_10660 [Euryarchaeota archaeon]|nr:hypothetical protein [Euryarchaeota archaeon]
MQRTYIDTNVYYIPHINSHTNSRRVIESATGAKFTIVQSDYLYDEAIALCRRGFGKDVASMQRLLMLSIPSTGIISKFEWGLTQQS